MIYSPNVHSRDPLSRTSCERMASSSLRRRYSHMSSNRLKMRERTAAVPLSTLKWIRKSRCVMVAHSPFWINQSYENFRRYTVHYSIVAETISLYTFLRLILGSWVQRVQKTSVAILYLTGTMNHSHNNINIIAIKFKTIQ